MLQKEARIKETLLRTKAVINVAYTWGPIKCEVVRQSALQCNKVCHCAKNCNIVRHGAMCCDMLQRRAKCVNKALQDGGPSTGAHATSNSKIQ